MDFEYKNFTSYFNYLQDDAPFQKLTGNQDLVNKLFALNPQPRADLQYLIIYQFLDPLIEALETKPNDTEKFRDLPEFQKQLNILKQHRQKYFLNLQHPDPNEHFASFKDGKVRAKLGDDNRSFAYTTPQVLQIIIQDMSKIYIEKGKIPCTFEIIPDTPRHSSKSAKEKNDEIVQNVLTGAAKAGLQPEQVNIMINGIKQTPENNEVYKNWQKEASEKFKERMKKTSGFKYP